MQKVKLFFLLLFIFILHTGYDVPKPTINWLSFTELEKAYADNPKPILIDVYTHWCGWCKVMDRETYGNEKVVNYINNNYYAVKLNAESTDSISFGGKTYHYEPAKRANQLATYLLYGRLEFPTTVFLSAINAQPAPLSGFLKPANMEAPLKFFGDGAYKTQTFVAFEKKLKKDW
jgi:thioredoxin-related protein